jgi:hypothetical protein
MTNNRPEIQVIVLNKELREDEIQRNLDKSDNEYQVIDNEKQLIMDEVGKRWISKTVLYSYKLNKLKVLVFL